MEEKTGILSSSSLSIRPAQARDLETIRDIYNQGIEDGFATLESAPKTSGDMLAWFEEHRGRYAVRVAEKGGEVVGWASLNRYAQRCAYDGVADLSVYIARTERGTGVGTRLLEQLERAALEQDFHKIVLLALPFNAAGRKLYRKAGYREVGTFEQQGMLNGRRVDVMIMEKLLGERGAAE
ncbi:arsinothricin resistance N-acetyltransferase ArsN1 family A [Saccharibacillus alkalitolerans]|uniref:N-acetyltransferase n=1 Tax=Saccharibacillus alkalitolerans TaxID=2705290 RepID=A0ABX0FAL3_9BACL|nr:arsinothricin resistance N-acetyltransferase ArsN1 family A [Saccharibacillus alkalitolerans]NGZ75057.1 N-acetyltransferase [Saccharibacillus alkalitolerans]